jgi:metal-responsive CopG/Arc/MetJ family transcriptional regulator
MARPVQTKPSGSKKELTGRKHLNASLPQQLVFDFNAIAKRHGHGMRDALVEELLRRFLEMVEPDSRSLRATPASSIAKSSREAKLSAEETSKYRERLSEHEAIRIARERAAEILDATSGFLTRLPAKRAATKRARKRRAS